MRIYTKAGDLAFKTFDFPDGQPHFKLETYEREFSAINVETALRSPADLFLLAQAVDVLRQHGYAEIQLDIRYLLGARMDRAISALEPFTLQLVARWINSLGLSRVRILDAHSEVATRLIRNSANVLPSAAFAQVCRTLGSPIIVVPDKGAVDRCVALAPGADKLYCRKERDPKTGALSGFSIVDKFFLGAEHSQRNFLITDDICDGGGTFVGIYKKIREAGPRNVFLFVTHGIFSKGLPLEGIDRVFTTDSYFDSMASSRVGTKTYCFDDARYLDKLTVIPVSMKEMP